MAANGGYSSDWVGEGGLNLDPGYCVTIVAGLDPRSALHRLGVPDTNIRSATWPELTSWVYGLRPEHFPIAAFVLDEYTVVVEENGYLGRGDEWAGPLSKGTEAVSVYLSPSNANQELYIHRDGAHAAFIDGDAPDEIDAVDERLQARLAELTDLTTPDLLRVACDYLGLRPTVSDTTGPVVGAAVSLRSTR